MVIEITETEVTETIKPSFYNQFLVF